MITKEQFFNDTDDEEVFAVVDAVLTRVKEYFKGDPTFRCNVTDRMVKLAIDDIINLGE